MAKAKEVVTESWIAQAKKLMEFNRKVDVESRHALALHLLDGVNRWGYVPVCRACGLYVGIKAPTFSALVKVAEVWPTIPVTMKNGGRWSHLVVCVNHPDLLETAIKGDWSFLRINNTKAKKNNGKRARAEVSPSILKELVISLMGRIDTRKTCPPYLVPLLNKLASKCIMLASLPAK